MKKVIVLLLALFLVLLSGCATVDKQLENVIFNESAIQDDSEYQIYEKLEQSGQLDKNGAYLTDGLFDGQQSAPSHAGSVHVTFAENRYLKIRYYSDAELTTLISNSECYLNPGDSIYASVESRNTISNLYGISRFQILEYDADGNVKGQYSQIANSNLVYTIPPAFAGTELSIVPVGEYPDRNLSMRAYYIDDNGAEVPLANAGVWYINEEQCRGNKASISPIVSYSLKYDFDDSNYFFVSSHPACFTAEPDRAGFVEFWEADPTDEDIDYLVELRPYLNLTILFDEKATVSLNGGEAENIKKGKTWQNTELRYGDVIVIETAGKCTLSSGDFNHVFAERDPITGGYRYTLSIQKEVNSNASTVLDIDEYITITLPATGAHGTCTYKLDSKPVSGTITLQLSQKLTITYTITDSEYKFETSGLESAWRWGQDLVGNMSKTAIIPLSPDMNNTTIIPDSWFTIVKKGA